MSRYHVLLSVYLILLFLVPAFPAGNTTAVVLSPGYARHGDPNVICRPSDWTDMVAFFFGNYIVHAATIMIFPGENLFSSQMVRIVAIFFPTIGLRRALLAIRANPGFTKSVLEGAARAGALCTVVSDKDGPKSLINKIREEVALCSSRKVSLTKVGILDSAKIHGKYLLPEGYTLVVVPSPAKFEFESEQSSAISYEYGDVVDVIIALGQTVLTIGTLYQTRGDQLARYGYAAFGLTAAPYVFMALLNFLAHLLFPRYGAMYLVGSNDMMKAMRDGGQFEGFVGVLTPESQEKIGLMITHETPKSRRIVQNAIITAVAAVPIAIVGGLSLFQGGSSTTAQRVWTMMWLAFGTLLGPFLEIIHAYLKRGKWERIQRIWALLLIFGFSAPAIGCFVVVGQMLHSYGVCIHIT